MLFEFSLQRTEEIRAQLVARAFHAALTRRRLRREVKGRNPIGAFPLAHCYPRDLRRRAAAQAHWPRTSSARGTCLDSSGEPDEPMAGDKPSLKDGFGMRLHPRNNVQAEYAT